MKSTNVLKSIVSLTKHHIWIVLGDVAKENELLCNMVLFLFFFVFLKKVFGGHMSFFRDHWDPCFGFLVMSPLGFKARVGSALFTIFAEVNETYIPQDSPLVLHLPTSWQPACSQSLPHMHVQRWDLAQIQTCNHVDRRGTRLPLCQRPGLAWYCLHGRNIPMTTIFLIHVIVIV